MQVGHSCGVTSVIEMNEPFVAAGCSTSVVERLLVATYGILYSVPYLTY